MRAIVSFLQVEAQRKEVLCQVPRHEAASPSLAGMGGEGRASGRLPALVSGSPRAHPPPTPWEKSLEDHVRAWSTSPGSILSSPDTLLKSELSCCRYLSHNGLIPTQECAWEAM